MKKFYSFLAAMLLVSMGFVASAQTVVGWDVTPSKDSTVNVLKATHGTPANIGIAELTTNTGNSIIIATNSTIRSTGWDGEAGKKAWLFGPINLTDVKNALSLSMKAQSSNTGPQVMKVEYSVGKSDKWIGIGSYTLITSSLMAIKQINLPTEILGKDSVYLRSIVAVNNSVSNKPIAATGTNRVSAVYINTLPTAEPTISVASGKFLAPFKVAIEHADSTAAIYYTLDGTTPVVADSLLYKDSLEISANSTLSAIAVVPGLEPSKVVTAEYKFPHPTVAFKGLENGGQYTSPLHLNVDITDFDITTTGEDGDGYVRFESPVIDVLAKNLNELLFGGEEVIKNPFYCDNFLFETMPEFPIELEPGEYTATVALVDLDSNLIDSTLMQTITFNVVAGEISVPCDTVIFLDSNVISLPVISKHLSDSVITVTITDSLFTADQETLPIDTLCLLNLRYVGPTDTTINANLILSCGTVVDTIVLNYGLSWDTCAAPTFSIAEGTYKETQVVTLTCATPNAAIFYTTDGTKPTLMSNIFTTPINVDSTMTIMAFAQAMNAYPSEVVSAKYVIEIETGINENEFAGIKVYPNPTTSFINLELGNVNANRVDVIAANGQIVYSTTAVENNVQISFEGRANGIYFVRVATNDNKIIVKKVMKM